MAILFCGGEMEDFSLSGAAIAVATTAGFYRSTYGRMGVEISGGTSNANRAAASFAATNAPNLTCRVYFASNTSSTLPFLWLTSGGVARLGMRMDGSSHLIVEKYAGGVLSSPTVLQTATATQPAATILFKLDVLVDYQAAGRARVYVDNALHIDYSGDVTAGGSTTLDGLVLGSASTSTLSSGRTVYSEVIVADEDTRPLSLKTLAPNAAGDVTGWTSGAFGDIDDITASDVDLAISETANQVLSVNCTGMPTGASGLGIRALKSVAYAARGSTGPSKLALGVRQSSTNGFATATTLDTAYGVVSQTWTVNPVTGAAFTSSEIDALQLAYRSEA